MTNSIDIKKVIRGSTCEVSLDSLTKKGVKQVKVVNQQTITRLIAQTVDEVLAQRAEEITSKERKRIIEEAQARVDQIAQQAQTAGQQKIQQLMQVNEKLSGEADGLRQRLQSMIETQAERDQALQKLKGLEAQAGASQSEKEQLSTQNAALEAENGRLKAELAQLRSTAAGETNARERAVELEAENGRLQAELTNLRAEAQAAAVPQPPQQDAAVAQLLAALGSQMQKASGQRAADGDILKALNSLSEKIENLPAGGGGGGGRGPAPVEMDEVSLDFLLNQSSKLETNLSSVNVKQKTAGDVKGALDKLKELQKGGE